MTVDYIPLIKVFDVSKIDVPKKVTVNRRSDGKLWWMYADTAPTMKNNFSKIKISIGGIDDKYETYKFSQNLYNLFIYNNLDLETPQKFIFNSENNMNTFIYFIDEDEVIIIPKLPDHGQMLKFTLFENKFPILKLQSNPK